MFKDFDQMVLFLKTIFDPKDPAFNPPGFLKSLVFGSGFCFCIKHHQAVGHYFGDVFFLAIVVIIHPMNELSFNSNLIAFLQVVFSYFSKFAPCNHIVPLRICNLFTLAVFVIIGSSKTKTCLDFTTCQVFDFNLRSPGKVASIRNVSSSRTGPSK